MYSSFQSSAKVSLPSVKIQLTVPHNNNLTGSNNNHGTSNKNRNQGEAAVANSLNALQRSLDRQKDRQQQQQNSNNSPDRANTPTSVLNGAPTAGAMLGGRRQMRPGSSSSSSANNNQNQTRTLAAANRRHHHHNDTGDARENLQQRTAFDLQHIQSEASMNFHVPNLTTFQNHDELTHNNNLVDDEQLAKQLSGFQLSKGMERVAAEVQPKYNNGGGYSAFQYALETALRKLEKQKVPLSRAGSRQQQYQNTTINNILEPTIEVELPMEERWRALADCLTSLNLNQDLHKTCHDIELVIEEIQKAKAYEQAQHLHQQYLLNSGDNTTDHHSSSMDNSPSKKTREAKARLNGTQTAMAVMLLEQCLHAVSDAAPYSKPALSWVLDTVLGSIYVSYDIVKNDLNRSYEPLRLATGSSCSSSSNPPNAEKLISRFYSKTFFQAVRSLSTAARAHADHAEEIERAKTRQSRVLERAISYWARYSMRRVLGAWRGFAKNEKIERELRNQVDELQRETKLMKDLEDQRERDREASGFNESGVLGVSAESLQLQVRELQRALEFERRRATRAEAALAVRVVDDRHNNRDHGDGSGDGSNQRSLEGDDDDLLRSQSSAEMTNLRAEVAHYRAVAVEACRLGDIDLHELERAVTAQTNVLARGMNG